MSSANNDWIHEHFTAGSRDVTPAGVDHAVKVLFAPVAHDPQVSRRCASVLSHTEQQRAERFALPAERDLFIQRRAFRRFCAARVHESSLPLARIAFRTTGKGRPFLTGLPDFCFGFSACRFGFLGAWSSSHGIGVDIEDQTRAAEATELAHAYFSPAEARLVASAERLKRRRTFFQLWSLKEAALKCVGEGLPLGLDAFQFELRPCLRIVHVPSGNGNPGQFSAHILKGTGSCAALVIQGLRQP